MLQEQHTVSRVSHEFVTGWTRVQVLDFDKTILVAGRGDQYDQKSFGLNS